MSHLTVCTPTKSTLYFANSLAAVASSPELDSPRIPSPKSHVNFPLLTSFQRGYLNLVVNSTPFCKANLCSNDYDINASPDSRLDKESDYAKVFFFGGGPLFPPSKFPTCFTVLNVTFIKCTNPATDYRPKYDAWSLI